MNRAHLASLAPMVLLLAACDDGGKASQQSAADEMDHLLPVVKEDIAQVRRGLPEGAKKLGTLLDADTLANPAAIQRSIARARADVKDLAVAKSTWFSYADTTGTVLRSESDPDTLAGKSVLPAFPALKKALEPAGAFADGYGKMPELVWSKKNEPDMAWLAAVGVKDDKGAVKGIFVTGWSFRAFAYHLEQSAKMAMEERAKKAGKKNTPIGYVYIVKGKAVYGAPATPGVNEKKLEELDVLGKTSGGAFRGTLEISNRVFGLAAARVPEMGDDAAVAVLASDI